MKPETLILGIGNEILTDDGIGPKLVKQLEKESSLGNAVYETASMGGLDILEFIKEFNIVIFIDAIKTKGGIPGDIYYLTTENFRETLHLSSLHDISFLHAIELGRQLQIKVPEEIHIIAIEIVEDLVFDDKFSPEIEERYEEIYTSVKNHIQNILKKS